MQVILIKSVADLGEAGTLKNVRPGYARNYLIPNGLAEVATSAAIAKAKTLIDRKSREQAETGQELKNTLMKIDGCVVTLTASANQDGKLYGSITETQILTQLSRQIKTALPKHLTIEPSTIKLTGQTQAKALLAEHRPASFIIDVKSSP